MTLPGLFALRLGLRYALSTGGAAALVGRVAVAGLALGVAVLVLVLSVVNGFERELRERVFGILPHASLHAVEALAPSAADIERLRSLPGVLGAAPFVAGLTLGMGADKVAGVSLTGIDPDQHENVSAIGDFLPAGWSAALEPGRFRVILGERLAQRLQVGPGDRFTLMLPNGVMTPVGLLPRQRRFEVAALLRSSSELDTRAAFVHWQDAARLFRMPGQAHGYQLRLADPDRAGEVADLALSALPQKQMIPRTWRDTHGYLYRAIGTQKATMFVLLSVLVAVAAFNLVSTLVMAVERRAPDIAILKTVGAGSGALIGGFLTLGLATGSAGIGLGLILGLGLVWLLPPTFAEFNAAFGLDLMNQYFIHYLPVAVWPGDLAAIVGIAFGLCLAGALLPAWRASRLLPGRVLASE